MFTALALIVSGVLTTTGFGCIAYLILVSRSRAVPMWVVILVTFVLLVVEDLIWYPAWSELQLTIKTANRWLIDVLGTDDLSGSLFEITTTDVVLQAVKAAIGAYLGRLLVRRVLGHERSQTADPGATADRPRD